jgi:erythromycin esterase
MKKELLIFFSVLILLNRFSYAQEIVNGGFEMLNNKHIPRGWIIDSKDNGCAIGVDSIIKHSGKYSIRIDGTSFGKTGTTTDLTLIANTFGALSAQKLKTIEINAWMKVSAAADSAVALFIQDLKGEKIIRTYAKNTNGQWQKLSLKFTADANKPWYGFYYGAEIGKQSVTYFDDISIRIDGKLISDPFSTRFEPEAENINWLNAHLSPLKSAVLMPAHDDLEPIGKLCADAKVVGIGEPTHGTSEALKFKLRLLEYLVTKKGFTTIALEEAIPTCDIMNEVLNTNNGSIKDSLVSLPFYKLWKTAEIEAMLAWVSKYNQAHAQRVNFIGIDMEDRGMKTSRRMLRRYWQHNQPALNLVNILDSRLDTLLKTRASSDDAALIMKLADSVKFQIEKIGQVLKSKAGNIKSKEELFKLQTYVRVCQQWLNVKFYNGERDELMADNIGFYLKDHQDDKVLVWAHNFHIANNSSNGVKSMGAYLKQQFASKYVPIGFTSAQGTYNAAKDYTQKSWSTYTFETAYKGTCEYILSKAKSNFYFLPLNTSASNQKASFWLRIPMKHLDIGYIQSGGEDDYKFYGNLGSVFDGVVFCKATNAADSYLKK